jgi:uncharacterized protein (TIGR02246 family)
MSGVLAAAAVFAGPAQAREGADPTEAVRTAFIAYDNAWRTNNTQAVLDLFATDFEWTNSVGVRITDKADFGKFLTHVFKQADYQAGQDGPLKIVSIRLLCDDVAVVSSAESTFGQKDYRTHKPVPEQRSNELTVMRRIGGRWLIVSDLTSDESHGI